MALSRSKPPRILIVSDGRAGTEAAALLTGLPYELDYAATRELCLAAVVQRPQLVLLDFALASTDPLALCLEIASLTTDLPILALASSDDDITVERAFGAGADDVILPPLRRIILRQRVGRLIKEVDLASRLREQDRLNHQLFDQNNVLRVVIEPDSGAILDANPAACQFYGYARDAFRQKRLNDLDAQPTRQMMQRAFRATAARETYFVFTHRLASGEMREVEMYCAPIEYMGRRATQVVLHDITQRKQIELRLRESEERYLKILELSNDAVFTLAPDTTVTFLSHGFSALAGAQPDDWIGRSFVPLIYFDDLPLALNMFDKVLHGEVPPPFELRFNTSEGYSYGEIIINPQMDNREVVGIWGAVRDVTKRRVAERSEREQRALAEALRDTAATLNGTLNLDELLGRILVQVERVVPSDTANVMLIENGFARVVRCRGYAERGLEADVLEMRFEVANTPNMQYMVESGQPFVEPDVDQYEGWVVTNGSTSWIRSHVAAPIHINGQVIGFLNLDSAMVHSFSDLDADRLMAFADQAATAIRNAELFQAVSRQTEELERRVADRTAQLEHERAQLRTILDSMNEGVIYDERFEVRYINRALTELVGYKMREWKGYLEMLRAEDTSEGEMRRTLDSLYDTVAEGAYWTAELRLRRKDGTEFDAAVTCSPVQNAEGEVAGAVTVIRDISQEKALQVQKQRFVAYASHELRTPITNLKTRLYLMRRQPGQLEGHLEILEEVTDRMKRLVEDLLDVSRFERGVISLQPVMVDVQALVNSVAAMQTPEAERKDIAVRLDFPSDRTEIYGDPERIVQVITNLVVNAINYTPPGGEITLAVRPATRRDRFVTIDVQDTGVGIAPEHLQNIFQPFFRVDKRVEGTGLGLSITQQIVELHGGKIAVDSEVGVGSTFHVRLPNQAPEDMEPVAPAGPANALQHS